MRSPPPGPPAGGAPDPQPRALSVPPCSAGKSLHPGSKPLLVGAQDQGKDPLEKGFGWAQTQKVLTWWHWCEGKVQRRGTAKPQPELCSGWQPRRGRGVGPATTFQSNAGHRGG